MSQADEFLTALLNGEVITPAMAYDRWGSLALHSRAADLRARGYDVRCRIRTCGKSRWGEYSLASRRQVEMFTSLEAICVNPD